MSYFTNISIVDDYGNDVEATMMNQIKIAESNRLAGGNISTSSNGNPPDVNFWNVANNAGGTTTVTDNEGLLTTTTTSGSSTQLSTFGIGRYMSGASNFCRAIARFTTGGANNVRRLGVGDLASNPTNGCFFELNNATFNIVTRKNGTDTIVASGSFNGAVASYTLDQNYHTFEIYYTNKRKMFVIDGVVIHTVTATTTQTTATLHFRSFASNINIGVGPACTIGINALSIIRLGKPTSQSKGIFQQGITTGLQLKVGIGSVHSLNISGITNNAVVAIWDGIVGSGTLLYSTGTMYVTNQSNNLPVAIPLDGDGGVQFQVGLYIVISGAACNCLIKFE